MTTRSVTCGSSSPVRAKGPRKLVPQWLSNPSTVRANGTAMTPALLTRTSIRPSHSEANARTEASEPRSSSRTSAPSPISTRAASAFSRLRQAMTTRAPLRANAFDASSPMPEFAPVTTNTRPVWSGMSARRQTISGPT